ncbi:MAG: O-antigen ligase family protein [Hyphomicrobiaceae bacterium]
MATALSTPAGNLRNQVVLGVAATLLLGLAAWFQPLAVGIGALPLVIWLVIVYPATWIIVFMALSQYRLPDAFPFLLPLHLPLAFGAMALGALVWHVMIARGYKAVWRPELVAMLVILALSIVGLPLAIDKPKTLTFIFDTFWKVVAVSIALAWIIRREIDFKRFTIATLACGTLIGLVALYNKAHGIDLVEGTRVTIARALNSPLSDPNDLALALMCPFSLGLAILAYRTTTSMKLLAVATVTATLLGIIATQSRGGLLAVLAGIAVVGLNFIRSRNALLAIVGALAVLLFIAMGISGRQSGGFEELSESGIDESSYLRTILWQAAINMALHRPFTGVGLAGFSSAFYFYTPVWVQKDLAPHSAWFGMLGEVGIPGLLALLYMIGHAFLSIQHCRVELAKRQAPALMQALALGLKASLVTFCVAATFLSQHASWPLYTIVALGVALRIYVDSSAPSGEPVPEAVERTVRVGAAARHPGRSQPAARRQT